MRVSFEHYKGTKIPESSISALLEPRMLVLKALPTTEKANWESVNIRHSIRLNLTEMKKEMKMVIVHKLISQLRILTLNSCNFQHENSMRPIKWIGG